MVSRRSIAGAAACLLSAGLFAAAPPGAAGEDVGRPRLRLIAPRPRLEVQRPEGRAARLSGALFLGVTGAPLDLRVRKDTLADPLRLTQVLHGPEGRTEVFLDPSLLDGFRGLRDFLRLRVMDASGSTVWTQVVRFCPNHWQRQRLDDSGPDVPTFPYGCYSSPRLLGMTWGIDEGWAVRTGTGLRLPVPDGTYSVEVVITRPYRELFAVDPADSSITLEVEVTSYERRGCRRCKGHAEAARVARTAAEAPAGAVPDMTDPPDSVLPDMRTLPAFNMKLRNRRDGRSFLRFAATVWVGGDAPIVVEGFRRQEEPVMDAYQYFYENGEPVGRAPAGTFVYDTRHGHRHWHILQFVRYRLLDADMAEAVRSRKESFCIVPTDAVDLSLDAADRTGEGQDLPTSCGGSEALWIRETLPVGWGDTYYQSLPGQAFDVTDLPNGTYYVEVSANPDGLLHEQDATNNASVRKVVLKGKPGARQLVVQDLTWIDGW